ncbi:MAG TPA: MATE family efflux transporter [Candidatus Latescibacteria bacterium]|nr:MATE family efflux transporter [Candidatus Latescibacterota bacterium]
MKEGSSVGGILKKLVPAGIDLSSQTVMWTVEAILVGHLGSSALGGVGMALQLVVFTFALLLTFVLGTVIIVTRHLGAGRQEEANHYFCQAFITSLILSVTVALVWSFLSPFIFKTLIGASVKVASIGTRYIQIVSAFSPLIIGNFVLLGIIRGAGDTHLSMMVNLLINGVNVCLAPVLIFGLFGAPRLETDGAAIAVSLSHTAGFVMTVWLVSSGRTLLRFHWKDMRAPSLKSIRRLVSLGVPVSLEQLAWTGGQLVVMSYAARLGTTALAAHQIILRFQSVLSMLYQGFGIVSMTLVGKSLGARMKRAALNVGWTVGRISSYFALAMMGVMLIFSRQLVMIFSSEPSVVAAGSVVLKVAAIFQLSKSLNIVSAGNLRGVGDTKFLLWVTLGGVFLFEVWFAWIFAFVFGLSLVGLWLATGLDETTRMLVNFARFRLGYWKEVSL